jgi:hypothetical protein
MTTHRLHVAAALAVALSACAGQDRQSPLDSVPDAAGLTLELQGGAPEQLALESAGTAVSAAALAIAPPTISDDLSVAREKIAAVNAAVRSVFTHVEEIAKANGAPAPGEVMVYGPVDRCVAPNACADGGTATLRLKVVHVAANVWAFVLDAQVATDWKPVAAGWLRKGDVARRGAGRIALNLQNLKAAAPAYPGQGYLLGGFANGPVAKALQYRLVDFTPDPNSWPATTAAVRGFKTAAGVTRVRLAEVADLYGSPPSQDELGFAHVAWAPTVGGRAYAIVANTQSGGDVPVASDGSEQYFFGRACYLAGQSTAAFKEWFVCPRGVGPRACVSVHGGAGDVVTGATGATWQNTCALAIEPPELEPPEGAPAATPDDTTTETGEAQTSLTPETPPSSPDDVAAPAM